MKQLYKSLIFLGIFVVTVAGIFWMGQNLSKNQESASVGAVVEEYAPKNGKVTLVEFSDFQCPACKFFHPIVKQMLSEYGDKIEFTYKYFPLKSIHKNADLAARAGEAAKLQNKFFEMSDLLFTNQDAWAMSGNAEESFAAYAGSLGMDKAKFLADLNSDEVSAKVNADLQEGTKLGVRGTPTFYVNGLRITNPGTYNEFKSIIDRAIAK